MADLPPASLRPSRTRGVRASVLAPLGVVVLVFAALGLVPVASGHGAASTEFESTVTKVTPDGLPITAEVVSGDDRLRVTNTGDEDLVVYGYEGDDPYVRIGPDGVFVNHNSSAYYTNQERYGTTEVPDDVGDGPPEWRQQPGDLPVYEFHDHRIHWMLTSLPPGVDAADSARQSVFDWTVDFRYGEKPGTIHGTLTYIGGGRPAWQLPAAIGGGVALLLLAGGGIIVLRRRRRARAEGE